MYQCVEMLLFFSFSFKWPRVCSVAGGLLYFGYVWLQTTDSAGENSCITRSVDHTETAIRITYVQTGLFCEKPDLCGPHRANVSRQLQLHMVDSFCKLLGILRLLGYTDLHNHWEVPLTALHAMSIVYFVCKDDDAISGNGVLVVRHAVPSPGCAVHLINSNKHIPPGEAFVKRHTLGLEWSCCD